MKRLSKQFIFLAFLSFCQSLVASDDPGWVIFWGANHSGTATEMVTNVYGIYESSVGVLAVNGQVLSNIISVAAGGAHGLALKEDRTVVGWGWNFYGQTRVPAGLSNVVSITAGENFSLALKQNGTVSVWGENEDSWQNNIDKFTNIVAVSAGGRRSVAALKSDGTIAGATVVSTGLSNIVAVTAEMSDRGYILALKKDGTVVESNLRDPPASIDIGVSNIVAIASGLALDKNGILYERAYGNKQGSAIYSNITAISTFGSSFGDYNLALKTDGTVVGWGHGRFYPRIVPAGLSNVVAIAVGGDFCLAITTNAAVAERFMPESK